MPYIVRDAQNHIIKASARAIVGAETLPHGHPDVQEFLRLHGQNPDQIDEALNELRRTDGEMSRAVEDIIMVLMKKNLVKMSDLPKPVQDRMALRVKLRVFIQEVYDQASGIKAI
jgi:hypothetical protein